MKKSLCLLFVLNCLIVFEISCKPRRLSLKEFSEYSNYLKEGNLNGVKSLYKRFGKYALQEFGIVGVNVINPVEAAIILGHYEILEFLLSKGANPNGMAGSIRMPVIFICISHGTPEMVSLFLKHKVDLDVFSINQDTPIRYAAMRGNLEILKLITTNTKDINVLNGDKSDALYGAAGFGHLDCTKFLIEQGININNKNMYGGTALSAAVIQGHLEIAKYLISCGADIDITIDGVTLIDFAKNDRGIDLEKIKEEQMSLQE